MGAGTELLTLGIAATRIGGGVQFHHLNRLAKQDVIPYTRAGRIRLVRAVDLDAIRAVCIERGYCTAGREVANATA